MTSTGRLDAFIGIGMFDNVQFSAESKVVPAHGKALIDTQLSIAVPIGSYGRVAPRSGLGGFSLFSSRL